MKAAKRIVEDQHMLKANKKYIKNLLARITEKSRTLPREPGFSVPVKSTFTIASDCSGLGTDHIAAKKAAAEQKIHPIWEDTGVYRTLAQGRAGGFADANLFDT